MDLLNRAIGGTDNAGANISKEKMREKVKKTSAMLGLSGTQRSCRRSARCRSLLTMARRGSRRLLQSLSKGAARLALKEAETSALPWSSCRCRRLCAECSVAPWIRTPCSWQPVWTPWAALSCTRSSKSLARSTSQVRAALDGHLRDLPTTFEWLGKRAKAGRAQREWPWSRVPAKAQQARRERPLGSDTSAWMNASRGAAGPSGTQRRAAPYSNAHLTRPPVAQRTACCSPTRA